MKPSDVRLFNSLPAVSGMAFAISPPKRAHIAGGQGGSPRLTGVRLRRWTKKSSDCFNFWKLNPIGVSDRVIYAEGIHSRISP
jgi:hypothetical protein